MRAELGSGSTSEVEARRDLGASRIPVGFYGSTPEVLAEPDQLLAPPKAA